MAYLAEIPYGAYWSTPFAKWQGSFANLHSVEFAAHVAKAELAKRRIAPEAFDYGVLGMTVPQKASFYGLPWFMGLIGGGKVGGPTIAQACATSVRCLLAGAQEIEAGLASHRADRNVRSHLQRSAHCLSQSVGAGRHRRARELGARQFQQRSARRPRHGADRRERRAQISNHHRRAARGGVAARRAIRGGAGQRPRVSETLHDAAVRCAVSQFQEERRHAARRRRRGDVDGGGS